MIRVLGTGGFILLKALKAGCPDCQIKAVLFGRPHVQDAYLQHPPQSPTLNGRGRLIAPISSTTSKENYMIKVFSHCRSLFSGYYVHLKPDVSNTVLRVHVRLSTFQYNTDSPTENRRSLLLLSINF